MPIETYCTKFLFKNSTDVQRSQEIVTLSVFITVRDCSLMFVIDNSLLGQIPSINNQIASRYKGRVVAGEKGYWSSNFIGLTLSIE